MCQAGVLELLRRCLRRELGDERQILVDRARDHVEIQPLRRARLLEHVTATGSPAARSVSHSSTRQAVALGLGDLLALLVQEQLVVEAFRRLAAEDAADLAGQLDRGDQVLARHLVIDAERVPAHAPVRLPLQLAALPPVTGVSTSLPSSSSKMMVPASTSCSSDRHLQHPAGLRR